MQQQLENYEYFGSISLNAVTQTNVPQPFSPSIDKANSPRMNMPENSSNQQIKFTSSDLQQTLHPGSNLILCRHYCKSLNYNVPHTR